MRNAEMSDSKVCCRSVFEKSLFASAMMIAAALSTGPAEAIGVADPLRFFEGRTEMVSLVKVVMKKPFRSQTIGQGYISPDGTLSLVQQVKEEGKQPRQRRWRIRQIGPGRYSGTMSEAIGPVQVRELGGKLRHMALQHSWAGAIQFFLECGDDGRMVVSGVVHAVAREEIQNAAAVGGEKF